MKPNRCTPMYNSPLSRCQVNWDREDGETACRHFIHDVILWSQCGHLATGHCLSGRAQDEARHAAVSVGSPGLLDQLVMKWAGPR